MALLRSFNVVCPFCQDLYPLPDDTDKIYRCRCGAVYKITWRSDMEDAVGQLTRFFLRDRDSSKSRSEDDRLYHVVIYEDIQNLMKMKTEYEADKYIRLIQSFDQNYYQKVGLVWLGNYRGENFPF